MRKERLEFEPQFTINNEMAVASFFAVSREAVLA
jgi:hypothetical protein